MLQSAVGSGGKAFLICVLGLLFILPATARVVINEVCYDPAGADSGYEWIELYNAGSENTYLEGAQILSGGSTYSLVYTLPYFLLRPGRYLLIGEANVPNAVFYTSLVFQNGGSETDGIRYVSPDGYYTDTVLYDEPNTNGLIDDSGNPGLSFAPDVPAGYSLARVRCGWDTDDSFADFIAEVNPTPGLSNRVYVDYALVHPRIWEEDGDWKFEVFVKNQAIIPPADLPDMTVKLDGIIIANHCIWYIPPGDSIYTLTYLPITEGVNHLIEAEIDLPGDTNPANNIISLHLQGQALETPYISEFMYHPPTGFQEWIEIHLPLTGSAKQNYRIKDAADNSLAFSLPPQSGYYVLCNAPAQLLSFYPDCPSSSVIQVSGWAALNNTGDSIYLFDENEHIIDSVSYAGVSTQQGKSLEHYQNTQNQSAWRYSFDPSGATPGRQNSEPAPSHPDMRGKLNVFGSPCKPSRGEYVTISYRLDDSANKASCKVYDRNGALIKVLANNTSIGSEGSFLWDAKNERGKFAPRGLYIILWESKPVSGNKIFRRQLTAVIYD
ncbi:MAG: lamin tail domain-containing protein [Candidatus Cloacimonadaceae bacterium]|nr:lamin tail domain-containing protein [Candidatus Cloacimonadaceae bacterium]